MTFRAAFFTRFGALADQKRHVTNRRRARLGRTPFLALGIERLEPRHMLSAVSWTGLGDGVSWSDPKNWSTDALPGAGDDVTINPTVAPNTTLTITHASGADTINSLNSPNSQVNLNLSGGSLVTSANSTIAGSITNSASLEVAGGSLELSGGVTSTGGTFISDARAVLSLESEVSLDGASSVSGAGEVDFFGDVVTMAGLYNVTGQTVIDANQVDFSGTVESVGATLSVDGVVNFHATPINVTNLTDVSGTFTCGTIQATDFTWSGGVLQGTGSVTVSQNLNLADTNSNGVGDLTLDGRTLNNLGTAVWTGAGNRSSHLIDGAVFNNAAGATFLVENLDSQIDGDGVFNNAGSLVKTPLNAGNFPTTIACMFNNSGSVEVQASQLALTGGVTSTGGAFVSDTGAVLSLESEVSIDSASSVGGAGEVDFFGDVVTMAGLYNVTGQTVIDANQVDFSGTVESVGATLSVDGVVNFHATPINVTNLTDVSGTFTCGTIQATDFTWSGGVLQGTGSVTVSQNLNLVNEFAPPTNLTLDGRTLNNLGTAVWTGPGPGASVRSIDLVDGAVFNNAAGATFLIENYVDQIDGDGVFNNAGDFVKTPTNALNGFNTIACAFNNTGSVEDQASQLSLTGGVTSTGGAFISDAGVVLSLASEVSLDDATTVTGAGEVDFFGDVVTMTGLYNVTGQTVIDANQVDFSGTIENVGATLSVDGVVNFHSTPINVTNLTDVSGTFTCGTIQATNFTWSGGVLQGTGSVTVSQNLTLVNEFAPPTNLTLDGRTLNNLGTAVWTGPGPGASVRSIDLVDGAVFNNAAGATFLIENVIDQIDGDGVFNNAGDFVNTPKNAGNGSNTIACAFNNSGSVEVQAAGLQFSGDVTTDANASGGVRPFAGVSSSGVQPFTGMSSGGQFIVDSGATLVFTGTTPGNIAAEVSGSGNVYFYPSYGFFWDGLEFEVTGTVQPYSSASLSAPVSILNPATIDTQGMGMQVFSPTFTGQVTIPPPSNGSTDPVFTKTGLGTLTLSGNDTVMGNIDVAEGALQFMNQSTLTLASGIAGEVTGTGSLELAGAVSAFTNSVNINNISSAAAGIFVSESNQIVGAITNFVNGISSGAGNVVVNAGAGLTVNSIQQNSLVIGAGATVTIDSSDAAGNPQVEAQGLVGEVRGDSGTGESATVLAPVQVAPAPRSSSGQEAVGKRAVVVSQAPSTQTQITAVIDAALTPALSQREREKMPAAPAIAAPAVDLAHALMPWDSVVLTEPSAWLPWMRHGYASSPENTTVAAAGVSRSSSNQVAPLRDADSTSSSHRQLIALDWALADGEFVRPLDEQLLDLLAAGFRSLGTVGFVDRPIPLE